MTRNFAVPAYTGIPLNFDKSADFGIIADGTAVQINKICQLDINAQSDAVGNTIKVVHLISLQPDFFKESIHPTLSAVPIYGTP
jgi:hypothetical protein